MCLSKCCAIVLFSIAYIDNIFAMLFNFKIINYILVIIIFSKVEDSIIITKVSL